MPRLRGENFPVNQEVEYTETELQILREAVLTSGIAVVMCEFTLISTPIEVATLAKELMKAAKKHPDNQLIETLFGETAGKKQSKPKDKEIRVTPENALEIAIAQINQAINILQQKAPSEIPAYQEFIYACASRVANAAGEGLLGTGNKVSQKEAATLAKLKTALSL
ncbi:hypothetical protein NIES2119_03550 [[Phormidium ambiguum] IAM M-71]|uniref:Uncharacterized protein n=1 Tax=[Phormidium ambiguum] IAM M-71 TaxID=454136 RepID=A0A1U7IRL3_9CYAN|nr:hypothetical protein [Phormidium ambiguum]OKH40035.1 hypothetical protein NIES2119_03550 [Phormidium ambiguum IAM M-71]